MIPTRKPRQQVVSPSAALHRLLTTFLWVEQILIKREFKLHFGIRRMRLPRNSPRKAIFLKLPGTIPARTPGLAGCNSVTSSSASLNIVAGSGGPSAVYTKTQAPWQAGFGDTARDTPDVSLFASDGQNGSFYIVCESDENIAGDTGCDLTKFTPTSPFHDFQAVGGTSASAPAFAGIMALVNQKTGQTARQCEHHAVRTGEE